MVAPDISHARTRNADWRKSQQIEENVRVIPSVFLPKSQSSSNAARVYPKKRSGAAITFSLLYSKANSHWSVENRKPHPPTWPVAKSEACVRTTKELYSDSTDVKVHDKADIDACRSCSKYPAASALLSIDSRVVRSGWKICMHTERSASEQTFNLSGYPLARIDFYSMEDNMWLANTCTVDLDFERYQP